LTSTHTDYEWFVKDSPKSFGVAACAQTNENRLMLLRKKPINLGPLFTVCFITIYARAKSSTPKMDQLTKGKYY
jgi:hypothetical protein